MDNSNRYFFQHLVYSSANIISTHVVYKIIIILSVSKAHRRRLTVIDEKTTFPQTGKAGHEAYVIPPIESSDRGKRVRMILSASYGLIDLNVKKQLKSNSAFKIMIFEQVLVISQQSTLKQNGMLVDVIAKVVHDILLTGVTHILY